MLIVSLPLSPIFTDLRTTSNPKKSNTIAFARKSSISLTPADLNQWQSYYDQVSSASFFQSPQWAELWARFSPKGYRPAPLIAKLPSDKSVLIPMTSQRVFEGISTLWHAAPAGTYGGWLMQPDQVLSREEQIRVMDTLVQYCGSIIMRWYPFSDDALGTGDAKLILRQHRGKSELISDRTFALDCSPGFEAIEQLWAGNGGSMKRKINKAERADVRIRRADSDDDIDAYYRMYLESIRRWDPPPSYVYTSSFFKLLADGDNSCEIWLAEWSGKIVAGAVIMPGRDHTAYWHGASASDEESRSVRPVNLLIARMIELTCERGHHWFDFNPSMGVSGVESFKKSFGATPFAAPVLRHRTRWLSNLQRIRSVLPLPDKSVRQDVRKGFFRR